MRIALIGCSDEERTAVTASFEADYVVAELPVGPPDFDFAVLGTVLVPGGQVPENVSRRVKCPAIAMLPSAAFFNTFDADMAAITIDGIRRLPFVIRRELRHDTMSRRRVEAALRAREAELRESEARYRDLVSQMPGVVWSADEKGHLHFISDRVAELTGYSREEILAADLEDFLVRIHEQDLASFHPLWDAMLAGSPLESDLRFLRKDGIWVWLHVRASVEQSQGVPRVVGVTTDVTDRRAAEDALRASEARYRTLVEGAQDVIVSIDSEGRVQSVNRAAEELTGASRVDWIGRSILEALGPNSVAHAESRFRAIFEGAPAEPYAEYELRTKTGRYVTMETQVRPVESHGGVVGIVIVARDVTARKEAHTRAEKDKRLASLGQLATSVAHEFNNVLMSIMPFAELLRRRMPDDERVITSTRHIIDAVRRGRDIAQEILRFARPANPEIENVGVSDWIEGFAKRARVTLGPLYTVEVELPSTEWNMAADRALLDQVAMNVTLNAREAMPDGGTFSIGARDDGEMVQLEFRDRGHGVPPEMFDRIFEPLFTTRREANGLGLSIAHQAMVQQGGAIHVRSTVGKGATFVVSLPKGTAAASERVPPRSRRVLVIEDDESVGEGLRALLTDEGFDVELVERGLQTAPAIERFQPDLVLLDVNLPDVSGIEVYRQIRAKWPALPVIFSTGHADSRALGELRDLEVPSIMKPYDFAELMSVVNDVT